MLYRKSIMYVFTGLLSGLCIPLFAQQDSIRYLEPIKIHGTDLSSLPVTPVPVTQFNADDLHRIPAVTLGDYLGHMAGVQLKDYGGLGGLKTVSVRGLGANHTGISYDGVTLTDGQTGQLDLSRFPVKNVDRLTLSIGPPTDLLLTAREYSTGSLLRISTSIDQPDSLQSRASLTGGSLGMFSPTLLIARKGEKIKNTVFAEAQFAHGDYPFRLENGDSTHLEKRKNADIVRFTIENDLGYDLTPHTRLNVKMNYFQSERGLPGPVIYYNPHSSQRLWDRKWLARTSFKSDLSDRMSTRAHIQFTHSYQHYLDPDFLSSTGKRENTYRQHELYLSNSWSYRLNGTLSAGLASDLIYGGMSADLPSFTDPERLSWLMAGNLRMKRRHLTVIAGGVYTKINENRTGQQTAADLHRLTPSLSVQLDPGKPGTVQFRGFYQSVFRLPTFSDLYFSGIGNTRLKPENARQLDLGITWVHAGGSAGHLFASLDAFYSQVDDKIVALPTKNIYIWSMMNLGKVNIRGLDLSLRGVKKYDRVRLTANASYTYQRVTDKTDPESKTYNDQIAYVPEHSASLSLGMQTTLVNITYNIIFSGPRYALNQNIPANSMNAYADHSLSLEREFALRGMPCSTRAECLNLLNTSYAVVRNYPMPGRTYRFTLTLNPQL